MQGTHIKGDVSLMVEKGEETGDPLAEGWGLEQAGLSQPQDYSHFRLDNALLWEAVLCLVSLTY